MGHCAARLERSETDVHPVDCPFHWSKNRQTMGNSLWENTHKVLKFGRELCIDLHRKDPTYFKKIAELS